jgi:hypothetical protein
MRARVPCCRSALGRGADQSPSFAVYAPWIARRLPHASSGCIVEGLGCRWITLRVPHDISRVPYACGYLALCRLGCREARVPPCTHTVLVSYDEVYW